MADREPLTSRFVRFLFAAIFAALSCTPFARAQLEITGPDLNLSPETYAVAINGVDVSERSKFYLADDDTVYASAPDLAAWGLRYQQEPAFARDGVAYYGLQSQLNLAVSIARPDERLEIVAPPAAFIGGPDRTRPLVTPGGGFFFNYDWRYANASFSRATTTGTYNLFFTHNASALNVDYGSTQTSAGMSFLRRLARWYHLDAGTNSVLQLGESSINAGDVGTSESYLGVRVASRFLDPLFITHALPTVTGVAATPSQVEVYINGLLQWREDVDAGPFVIKDLPASAAFSDIDLVITDSTGKRTVEVVRPDIDLGFLRPGLISYNVDAGWARAPSAGAPRYKDLLASTIVRYGLKPWLTLQAMGESVAGVPFAALGFEMLPGPRQQATFWYGDGKLRRQGFLEYRISSGKFDFSDKLTYIAETQNEPPGFDIPGIGEPFARFSEEANLRYNPNDEMGFELRLNREVSNNGPPASVATLANTFRLGRFSISLTPRYDVVDHNLGVALSLGQSLSGGSLSESADKPAYRPIDTTLEYRKYRRDMNDPWSYNARVVAGSTDVRFTRIDYRSPWSLVTVTAQDRNGRGTIQSTLAGALGVVGGALHTLRDRYSEQALGVARLPGFAGVLVDLNGSRAGYTNGRGNVILTHLSTLQENTITADLSMMPINVGVRVPVIVVPLPSTPVSVDLLEPKAQNVVVRIVDAQGNPLPPATFVTADDGTRFPIGLDGKAYIHGLTATTHRFLSDSGCSLALTLLPKWEIVDGGTVACR